MKPGRPATPRLSQTAILTEALHLLDQGETALTIRALATRLTVTPMAIQHHIGTRDALIHALSDHAFAKVRPGPGDAPQRLRSLIEAYTSAIRAHPALTLALFRIPGPLPAEAQRITDTLETLLVETGLPGPQARLWRDIFIDWAHGMALAQSPEDPTPALNALLQAVRPAHSATP
jgi:AcrR family transcriptional regulator